MSGAQLQPGKSFLNALGPRATSGARPTAGAQPEFTSGVKRSRRRTSSAGRTVCFAQTGDGSRRALACLCPPAVADFCPTKSRTVVSKERISRFLSEKESARRGGADFGSAAGAGKIPPGRPFFNALGPRATSGVRPTAGAQPEFTSGVKRSRRRTSEAARTVCLAQTGDGSCRALGGHACTDCAARTAPARTFRLRGTHLSKLRTPFSATRPAFALPAEAASAAKQNQGGPGGNYFPRRGSGRSPAVFPDTLPFNPGRSPAVLV